MDWIQITTSVLLGLAVAVVMTYVNKKIANQKVEQNTNGAIELKLHRSYQVIGYIGIGFALMFVLVAIFQPEDGLYLIAFAMLVLFGGGGLFCLLYYQNHVLSFNDDIIMVKSWLGKYEEVTWDTIHEIKFHRLSGCLKLKGENKQLSIHQHLRGLKTFTDKMEEKTKWTVSELKLPI